jgi:magnesium chelatase family protein
MTTTTTTVNCATTHGIEGICVPVLCGAGYGHAQVSIVGLSEAQTRETRVRVWSALMASCHRWSQHSITVVLGAPEVRKGGTGFDLPIALALLALDEDWPTQDGRVLPDTLVVGELGLSGEVRPVRGILPMALAAKEAGAKHVLCARDNAAEAALSGLTVYAVEALRQAVDHLTGEAPLPVFRGRAASYEDGELCLSDIKGQELGKRALEIAAAGGHNLLLVDSPGAGKTMLARRLPTILPPLSFQEALELTTIYSVAGLLGREGLVRTRPFRAPHHTISDIGLVGGGSPSPRPGEITLAHHGVLFLDEMLEFRRHVLEVLETPLREGSVGITRRQTVRYPARAQLVCAVNPCACGYLGSLRRACRCDHDALRRHHGRLDSSAVRRLIDLYVEVEDTSYRELRDVPVGETSDVVRERVVAARCRQTRRLDGTRTNATMTPHELRRHCEPDSHSDLLNRAVARGATASDVARALRVARTVADLDGSVRLQGAHLTEALALTLPRHVVPPQQEATGAP